MNEKRLLRLAGLLEKHADNGIRFDLECWREPNQTSRNWCGTKSCAVGLAMGDRSFKRQGLKTEGTVYPMPRFNHYYGMTAAAAFFDVDFDTACRLFDPCAYSGKTYGDVAARKVAKRIHALVSDGGGRFIEELS